MSYSEVQQRFANLARQSGLLSENDEKVLAGQYFANRDKNSLDRLVRHNLLLVISIANHYPREEDILSEGMTGLVEGIRRFNPSCGTRISTYVTYWIKAYILDYVLRNHRLVRIGTTSTQKKLFFNLNKIKSQMHRCGQDISPAAIAEHLQVDTQEVVNMEQRLAGETRLDAPISPTRNDGTILDSLSCEGLSPDEALERMEEEFLIKKDLKEFRSTLSVFDQKVFDARLVTDEEDSVTLRDLGDTLGVSHECIRKAQVKMIPMIRRFIQRGHS